MNHERLKMMFGFAVLLVLGALACIVALGKVEQNTSYGLPEIIGGLLTLAGGFSGYAFGYRVGSEDRKSKENNDQARQE